MDLRQDEHAPQPGQTHCEITHYMLGVTLDTSESCVLKIFWIFRAPCPRASLKPVQNPTPSPASPKGARARSSYTRANGQTARAVRRTGDQESR